MGENVKGKQGKNKRLPARSALNKIFFLDSYVYRM
jgi:hypothetical protein